jgi:alpha-beta hydrolase superfamily lysophospholipase
MQSIFNPMAIIRSGRSRVRNETYHWEAKDNLPLFAQAWFPDRDAKAVICLVHGLGEHSQRYATHFAQFFTQAGYAVLTFDLRGHGRSGGQRGHTPSFDAYMEDIDILMEYAAHLFHGLPSFLYGHSLGGVLVLNYALRRKVTVEGVIATDPGLKTAIEEQKFKLFIASVLGSIYPTLSIPSGLVIEDLSRDPQVVSDYKNDPLVHSVVTTGFGKHLPPALRYAFEHASEFPVPLLLMHGSEDRVAYLKGSQEFARLAGPQCTLKVWAGCYHEIHNETIKEQVMAFAKDWMDERLLIKQNTTRQSPPNMGKFERI